MLSEINVTTKKRRNLLFHFLKLKIRKKNIINDDRSKLTGYVWWHFCLRQDGEQSQ